MKKLISAISVVALSASLFAMSAMAADYPAKPDYVEPIKSTELTKDALADVIEAQKDKAEVAIELDKAAPITKDLFAEIKKSTKPVAFYVGDMKIKINPADVSADVKIDNLTIASSEAKADTKIGGVAVPAGATIIKPSATGAFGVKIEITVPAPTVSSGKELALYYVSDDGKTVTKLANPTVKDGLATFTIDHASSYVLAEAGSMTETEDNKGTGVAVPVIAAGVAGVAALISKKLKK